MLQIRAALFYYKLGQKLLQIGAALLLQIRASVVTNWGSYYKLGQPLAVCFGATWRNNSLIPFFEPKKTFFTSINTKNSIIIYIHPFFTFNNPPLKSVYKEPTYTFFYNTQKSKFLKKILFEILNLKSLYA